MPYKDPERQRQAEFESRQRNSEGRRLKQQARRAEIRQWVASLKDAPCVDCGGRFHFAAMQWDHLPGCDKVDQISRLVTGLNRDRILEEIAKCELVCANCHATREYHRKR